MAEQPWGGHQPVRPQQWYGKPWPAAPVPLQDPQSAMRAAHTDRDRAVDVLKAGFAEGRLSREEYEQRFDAVHRARTYGELAQLLADLPAGPMAAPFAAQAHMTRPAFVPMPPPMPVPPRRVNGMAVASLVLGVLTLPTLGAAGLGAVVTGHIAKAQIRARGEEGGGPATVGLALGWLSLGGWALLFLLAVLGAFH